ncbi:MAG: hypothetical protein IJH43_04480 [Mogibacterium sp.]|nr:hypothetical protein [Mogibacterium sp.]
MKIEKRYFIKDLFVFWLAMAAMICAAINLNISLNMLSYSEMKKVKARHGKIFTRLLKRRSD